jgi:pimeloyl-ACP methyl ester carboxylesterase
MSPKSALPVNMHIRRPDGVLAAHRRGEGPVLLLLHGWTLDRRMWLPLIEALAPHHIVIAIDRRGSGDSDCPADLDAEIDDIDAVLDVAGVNRAHIAGMSQGGRIATRYAYLRQERVASLTLFAAPLDGFPAPPDAADTIPIARYRKLHDAGQADVLLNEWLSHSLMQLGPGYPELCRFVAAIVGDVRWKAILSEPALSPFAVDLSESLNQLQVPLLSIVGGDDSGHLRRVSQFIAAHCPEGKAIEIEGAGHLATLTHPSRIAGACLPFLADAEKSVTPGGPYS